MKQLTVLPLVAIISGLMVGCGGGGGGSSSPAPKSYKIQFVHMLVNQDPANISSTCSSPTYFKEYPTGNVDYAQVATNIHAIDSYNADGSFNQSLISKISPNGVLTFTENDVEDGGYITLIDNVGTSSSPIFHTISIQKQFLGNYLVNVESPQGNQSSCYQDGKLTIDKTQRVMNLSSDGGLGTITESGFETYRDGEVLTPSSQTIKKPIHLVSSNEYVLGKAYNNEKIKGYVLARGSELSIDGDQSPNSQVLKVLTDEVSLNWPTSPSYTFNSVDVKALARNERYKWQSVTNANRSILVSDELSYSLYMTGAMNTWSIYSVQPQVASSMDVELTETTVSSGIYPELVCSGGRCVVDNNGVVATDLNRLQRAYFEVSANSKHTIYAEPNNHDELIIPDYKIGNSYKPSGSEPIEVSYINYGDSYTSDFFELIMNKYNDPESSATYVDKVSVLKTPQKLES
ncbi:hypothetical protein D1115_05040 [Vibrio alfacsensis]|uniref:Lipoprotein n=1 Tax=Vibrio alfacsensis TaxID=1074311 RepID=A0ABN5PBU0_9VIBR|nr:hypothetical protein [Vibrio alfacsensis]AXY00693.1 hypothetical protein D1115_05040 [Vibrio alfacsensis]